jgi:hypothetical protein
MTSTEATCRSLYVSGPNPMPNTRIVRCGLAKGHGGDHDELIDGEAGIVTWADPEPYSLPRVSRSVIDMTAAMESAIGLRNVSLLGLSAAAWLEGFKAGLGQTPDKGPLRPTNLRRRGAPVTTDLHARILAAIADKEARAKRCHDTEPGPWRVRSNANWRPA